MCPPPYLIHPQVGGFVAGARQRLEWTASAAVCAYLGLNAVRTRPYLPCFSISLPCNARALTLLDLGAGVPMSANDDHLVLI